MSNVAATFMRHEHAHEHVVVERGIVFIGKLKRLLIVRVIPLEVRLLSIPIYLF